MATQLPLKLVEFLTVRLGHTTKPLDSTSGLEATYDIAGLDTIQFYEDFITEFNIRIPTEWDISNHVTSERLQPEHYLRRLFSSGYRTKTKYVDLTLDDLATMLETSSWLSANQ